MAPKAKLVWRTMSFKKSELYGRLLLPGQNELALAGGDSGFEVSLGSVLH